MPGLPAPPAACATRRAERNEGSRNTRSRIGAPLSVRYSSAIAASIERAYRQRSAKSPKFGWRASTAGDGARVRGRSNLHNPRSGRRRSVARASRRTCGTADIRSCNRNRRAIAPVIVHVTRRSCHSTDLAGSGTGISGASTASTLPGTCDRRCCFASWRAFRAASFCFFA
jgi:hypothetical protein